MINGDQCSVVRQGPSHACGVEPDAGDSCPVDLRTDMRRVALMTLIECSGVENTTMDALLMRIVRSIVEEIGLSPRSSAALEIAHRVLLSELENLGVGRYWHVNPDRLRDARARLSQVLPDGRSLGAARLLSSLTPELHWQAVAVDEREHELRIELSTDEASDAPQSPYIALCAMNTTLVFLVALFGARCVRVVECRRMNDAQSVAKIIAKERVRLGNANRAIVAKQHVRFVGHAR